MNKKIAVAIIITALLCSLIPISLLPQASAGVSFTAKSTMIQQWKTLCDAHPTEASYVSTGYGYYEGGTIYVFRIGNPDGGCIYFDAAMHGWEDIGTEIMYRWAIWLLTNNSVASNRILANNYILFNPVVTGAGWYDNVTPERGNDNKTNGKTYGVDINRNFVTGWSSSGAGTADLPSHSTTPADQNETKAVRYILQTYSPEIYVTTHYGGGPWCNSYGTNTTLSTLIKDRINALHQASYGSVFPWSLGSGGVGSGMAVGDGNAFGANSWMWEIAANNHSPYGTGSGYDCYMHNAQTIADINNWYLPHTLPLLEAMAEAVEVTGEAPTQHTLTISASTGGTTNPTNGAYQIDEGTTQSLMATESTGYDFVDWKLDGVLQGVSASWSVTMDADHTVQAIFSTQPAPPDPQTYGAEKYGNVPVNLIGKVNGVSALIVNVYGINLQTSISQYTLTVSTSTGGTTNPTNGATQLNSGTNQSLIATQSAGYQFAAWEIDGSNQTTIYSTWFVVMNGNHTAKAYFTPIQHTLTVSASTGGSTNPAIGGHLLNEGTNQTLVATPNAGYEFIDWEIDGTNQTATSTWFVVMNANHTAKAYFANPSDWLIGYANRISFNITDAELTGNLAKFPVLLTISNSAGINDKDLTPIFTELAASSRKMAITSSDGKTEVTLGEVELWNNAGNVAYIWATLNLTNGVDNKFYLYFDSSASDNALIGTTPNDAATNNVWDANYMMVQHLQGANAAALDDSSSNNNDVTASLGTPSYNTAEKIGNGVYLDRLTGEWLSIPDANTLDGFSEATWEFWFTDHTLPATSDKRAEFGKYNTTSQRCWAFALYNDAGTNKFQFTSSTAGTSAIINTYTWAPANDTLYQITLRWDSVTATTPVLYINGVATSWTVSATITSALFAGTEPVYIGSYFTTAQHDGAFDEVRISNLDRGAAYVTANYDSQIDNFVTWGNFESI